MMFITTFLCLLVATIVPVFRGQDHSSVGVAPNSIDLEIFHSNLQSLSSNDISRGIFSINLTPDGKKGLDPLKNGIFDQQSLDAFKKLLDKNALYQIRITKQGNNGTTIHSIISSIPAVTIHLCFTYIHTYVILILLLLLI